MRFTTLVLKNILRRPTRSALTVSGVAVAVAAVVALVGISRGFEKSLRDIYDARGVDLIVVRAGSIQRYSSVLDEGLGDRIAALPGVEEVFPGLVDIVAFEDFDLFGVVIQGMRLDRGPLPNAEIVEGRKIRPGDGRAVMLGKILAENIGKSVGHSLDVIEGEPYTVVGIYQSYNVFENGAMVMAIDELQRLMGREGEVTHFMVGTEQNDKQSLDRLTAQIKELAPALDALPTGEYVDTAVEMRMARSIAWLTSTIALVVGTIGMINTMMTAVFERTRELAVMRAIGWRKPRVIKMVLMESVVLGLAGAVAGTLLAVGLTQLLSSMPASGRLVAGDIAPVVVLQGFAIALGVGVAGGIYPAYRAAQLVPTEGLRHE